MYSYIPSVGTMAWRSFSLVPAQVGIPLLRERKAFLTCLALPALPTNSAMDLRTEGERERKGLCSGNHDAVTGHGLLCRYGITVS